MICLAVLWSMTIAVNAPGHLSLDSVIQLNEGRNSSYLGGHPPFMSAVLGALDYILPGTSLYIALSSFLFFLSVGLIIWQANRPTLRVLVFIPLWLLPVVFIYQGIVWKDVLFANLAGLSFALLVLVSPERSVRTRMLLYGTAGATAAFASLTRQNGVIIIPFLAGAIAWLETRFRHAGCSWSSALTASALTIVIAVAIQLLVLSALRTDAKTLPPFWGVSVIARYDIIGIISRARPDTAFFSRYTTRPQEDFFEEIQKYYSPERLDYLSDSPVISLFFGRIREERQLEMHRELIAAEPAAYIAHRLAVFHWMIWPPEILRCIPIHVGVEGLPEMIGALELQAGSRPADRALYRYAKEFFQTPVFKHGAYLFVAVLLSILLLIRRWLSDIPIIAMLLASMAFAFSYLLVGIGCDFRYLYFLPVATILGLLQAIGGVGWSGRREDQRA
jgi:hypothetical protein